MPAKIKEKGRQSSYLFSHICGSGDNVDLHFRQIQEHRDSSLRMKTIVESPVFSGKVIFNFLVSITIGESEIEPFASGSTMGMGLIESALFLFSHL